MPLCPTCGAENPPGAARCRACAGLLPLSDLPAERVTFAPAERAISVLVVDIVGTERGGDPVEAQADATRRTAAEDAVNRTRREIRLLGGALDAPGAHAAVGVFGAPVARVDAPERAVRAALRVVEAVEDLEEEAAAGIAVRAAVHTGSYRLAPDRDTDRGERLLPVEALEAAAALHLDSGPGVVVDHATHDTTGSLFEYEAMPTPARQTRAWVVRAARGRFGVDLELRPPAPFTGREHEIALLSDIYARVLMEGEPHLVTIVGQAGIGKSRLLAEFWNHLDARPELVYWRQGRCLGGGGGATLWALGEIVKGQSWILESDDVAAAAEKLEVTVGNFVDEPDQEAVRGRLEPLVGLLPDHPRPVPPSENHAAWRRFLEAVAATHPLVLVFEDLHLADPGTLAFVTHLAERVRGAPVLIVATARLELLERDRAWGGAIGNATTITLTPMSGRDVRMLMAALGGPGDATPGGLALLVACGGNPLYVESYLGLVSDLGADPAAPGIRPPETLHALMAARVAALEPEHRALLEDAAVVGKVFWPEALVAMGNHSARDLEEGLRELARRELVRPARRSSVEGQQEYVFWHLLLRDAAYDSIPPSLRPERHGAVVGWAERLAGDRVADHAELLAYHSSQAMTTGSEEARERARRFLAMAGDRAASLDPAHAAALYRRAAELSPEGSAERRALADAAARAAAAGSGS